MKNIKERVRRHKATVALMSVAFIGGAATLGSWAGGVFHHYDGSIDSAHASIGAPQGDLIEYAKSIRFDQITSSVVNNVPLTAVSNDGTHGDAAFTVTNPNSDAWVHFNGLTFPSGYATGYDTNGDPVAGCDSIDSKVYWKDVDPTTGGTVYFTDGWKNFNLLWQPGDPAGVYLAPSASTAIGIRGDVVADDDEPLACAQAAYFVMPKPSMVAANDADPLIKSDGSQMGIASDQTVQANDPWFTW